MRVWTLCLWWGGTLLLALLLCRMAQVRLLGRFPLFSAYLAAVFSSSLALLFLQPAGSQAYAVGYWVTEFVTAALSLGIVWEAYTEALAPYPGVRKMARSVLGILFAVVGAKTAVGLFGNHNLTSAIGEFERDLRLLLSLSLLALAGLIAHYAIPVGRNVLFMVVGYGLYLGIRVSTLNVFLDSGLAYRPWINLLLQCGWNSAAVVWCVGMWTYSTTRLPDAPPECDYESTSRQTIRALGELRNSVVDSWRL